MLSRFHGSVVRSSYRSLKTSTKNFPHSHVRRLSSGTASSAAAEISRHRPVAYWLLGVSGLIGGIVVVGGITRLTRSGLSMTDWKLQGSLPPSTEEEWEKEFERYKAFPEWKQRKGMTVEEFKDIFFWEYWHRMMGRFIGVAFAVPGLYFAARGMIPKHLYKRMGLLFALGGGQGLIGWWMVKSGLEMDPNQKKEIRVSPYRLATHLSMAFTTFAVSIWTACDILNPKTKALEVAQTMSKEVLQVAKKHRKFALHNLGIVGLTVLSGAYVAGNDAGNAYNTWPKMGDEWIPSEIFALSPWWKNITENTALVQFDHRILAYSTASVVSLLYYQARTAMQGQYWKALPRTSRILFHASMGMVLTQIALGISTLLLHVPLHLAVTHQGGAVVLLSLTTALAHSLSFAKHAPVSMTSTGLSALRMMHPMKQIPVVKNLVQKQKQNSPFH